MQNVITVDFSNKKPQLFKNKEIDSKMINPAVFALSILNDLIKYQEHFLENVPNIKQKLDAEVVMDYDNLITYLRKRLVDCFNDSMYANSYTLENHKIQSKLLIIDDLKEIKQEHIQTILNWYKDLGIPYQNKENIINMSSFKQLN